jgi:hypothetical protein
MDDEAHDHDIENGPIQPPGPEKWWNASREETGTDPRIRSFANSRQFGEAFSAAFEPAMIVPR